VASQGLKSMDLVCMIGEIYVLDFGKKKQVNGRHNLEELVVDGGKFNTNILLYTADNFRNTWHLQYIRDGKGLGKLIKK
jgi:hypothetical protein